MKIHIEKGVESIIAGVLCWFMWVCEVFVLLLRLPDMTGAVCLPFLMFHFVFLVAAFITGAEALGRKDKMGKYGIIIALASIIPNLLLVIILRITG